MADATGPDNMRNYPMKPRKPLARRTPLKPSSKPMKRSRIRPRSKKMAKAMVIYNERKKAYFEALAASQGRSGLPPYCEAWGAPHIAVDWHHILPKGRGGKQNQDEMMAVCRAAHQWITENPKEAEQKGWLLK